MKSRRPDRGSKISADLLQLHGNNHLVMVNHYGDCIEFDSLSGNTSADSVIRAMKRQFARHGIPDELITDNGPQFGSQLYLTARQRVQSYCGFTLCQRSVRTASPLPTTTRRARCFQVGDYAKISVSTTKRRCRPG